MKKDEDLIKRMARLLKSGATMLNEVCPVCGTPLFKLKNGEVICPKCNRRVYLVKNEQEEGMIKKRVFLQEVEENLLKKIDELQSIISSTTDFDEIDRYIQYLINMLEALERVRRLTTSNKSL